MDLPLLHDFLYRIIGRNTNYQRNFNNNNNLHFSSISVPENNNINIKNSLKILMVSTEYPPMYGGVGRYTYNLTRALRKLGHTVYVVCNDDGKEGNFFGLSSSFDKDNSGLLLDIVNKVKPDIVHIQFEHGLYGLKLSSLNPRNTYTNIDSFYDICKIPIVTTFHSAYTFKQWMNIISPLDLKSNSNNNNLQNQVKYLSKYILQYWKFIINYKSFHDLNNEKLVKSKKGIVFSDYMKNLIIGKKRKGSNGFANNKSNVDDNNIVIYHGAEPSLSPFPNIKEKARAKFGIYLDNDNKIKRKRRIALALGFKTSTKGWDILNEMDIPENWLIIVNSSKNHFNTENYKPKKIIKDFTRIIELQRDYLSDTDLSLLFYASDVVLLPYKVCSGSGVMFDALAHGLPFIATDLEFFKEFARKGLGLTVKRDPKEFKKALIDLENNYEYYCNSVNQFKLSLNWKNIADHHTNVYNSILVDTKSSKSILHSSTIVTTNTTTTTNATVLPMNKIKNS
ncbi:MAG TPA: glycosyltransferase family 4 protein [Nitrososphaeraceae archaeon]|nr:glycosyltransferase family 4 protein [Nitrososphaeraceae archaeon]